MERNDMTANALSDADELALNRLIIEVAWRVGHHEGDTIHELYTEDAVMEIGPPLNERTVGREELIEWGLRRDESVKIVYTNTRWRADGPDGAIGSCIVTSYLDREKPRLGTTVPNAVGETTFNCVRTAEGWRIARAALDIHFLRTASQSA
jgi:hypothetical protein